MLAVLKVLGFFLLVLFVPYILPFVLVIGAGARLISAAYDNRMRMALALALGLPQCVLLLGGPKSMSWGENIGPLAGGSIALTLAGAVLWIVEMARVGAHLAWLEPILVFAVAGAWIAFAPINWIAH